MALFFSQFLRPVNEGIRTEQGNHQGFHAAITLLICPVSFLQGLGIPQGLVASHEEAEDVADEDLLAVGGCGQALDQLEGTIHFAVDAGDTGVDDLARRIDRLMTQLGRNKTSVRDVQEPLNLTHQMYLMVIEASISIDHTPHPLDQLIPLIERPIGID